MTERCFKGIRGNVKLACVVVVFNKRNLLLENLVYINFLSAFVARILETADHLPL